MICLANPMVPCICCMHEVAEVLMIKHEYKRDHLSMGQDPRGEPIQLLTILDQLASQSIEFQQEIALSSFSLDTTTSQHDEAFTTNKTFSGPYSTPGHQLKSKPEIIDPSFQQTTAGLYKSFQYFTPRLGACPYQVYQIVASSNHDINAPTKID